MKRCGPETARNSGKVTGLGSSGDTFRHAINMDMKTDHHQVLE